MAWVVTAVTTAYEVMTVAAVAEAVAAVGTTLSVVGAVTGNKTLTKVGGVMGLAGGITGLVAGATSAGSAAVGTLAEGAVAEGAPAAAAEGAAALSGSEEAAALAGGVGGIGEGGASAAGSIGAGGESLGGVGSGMMQGYTPPPVDASLGEFSYSQPGASFGPADTSMDMGVPAAEAPRGPMSSTPAPAPAAANTADRLSDVTLPPVPDYLGGSVKPPGTGEGIMDWFGKQDPATKGRIINGLIQAGGAAIGGLFNGWTAEQKLALEQRRQDLEQERYNTSVSNANAQPKVAAYTKPKGMLG